MACEHGKRHTVSQVSSSFTPTANAGVLLGDACIGSGVALNYLDEVSERKVKVN